MIGKLEFLLLVFKYFFDYLSGNVNYELLVLRFNYLTMKKNIFIVLVLISACGVFSGCLRNKPYVTSTNPSMTATIGKYQFVASQVTSAVLDTQRNDTTKTLVITGLANDKANPQDKIILTVATYRGKAGTFSIVKHEANAIYYHGIQMGGAISGIVSITQITANSIIGYYSFNTNDSLAITSGAYNVGKP